ncbi:hypothetical protein [Micromonospora fluostatini]|uniref:hypothetical protein n=1 Tax=Micromonospora sp. JCM 30529 TaxID=3421643 RepID=UPI003D16CBF9
MLRSRRAVLAVLLTLAVAGCTGEPASSPTLSPPGPPVGDAVDPTGPPPATAGPVANGATWPDGLSARLVSVQRVPNSWGVDVPASLALVRLTLEVVNGSGEDLPVVPDSREMTLLHGPEQEEAGSPTGYRYTDPAERRRKALRIDGGTQIPVGGRAQFVESGTVPVDELGELTVVVDLPSVDGLRDPFTLTGVESLLKTVS